MLLSIATGYLVIGTAATCVMEVSARSRNEDNDSRLVELIDADPIGARTRLIIGWPRWVFGGIVEGFSNAMKQKEEK